MHSKRDISVEDRNRSNRDFLVLLCLAAATLIVYGRVYNCGFVNYDDQICVYQNPTVSAGLTAQGITWALRTTFHDFWHPLTWWSHMLDCELFGLAPGYHHLVNLAFHIATTLLLYATLQRITGAWKRSALVAALFALHPLHVESVAWIAERKDVLSTFFWMLTIWAYLRSRAVFAALRRAEESRRLRLASPPQGVEPTSLRFAAPGGREKANPDLKSQISNLKSPPADGGTAALPPLTSSLAPPQGALVSRQSTAWGGEAKRRRLG